jgi:hypothetical protein
MLTISLKDYASEGRLLGVRENALPIRDRIYQSLDIQQQVALDFAGTNSTQSFIDELVGVLIIERGVGALDFLIMKNCSSDTQAILHFVVSDRLDNFQKPATELV